MKAHHNSEELNNKWHDLFIILNKYDKISKVIGVFLYNIDVFCNNARGRGRVPF